MASAVLDARDEIAAALRTVAELTGRTYTDPGQPAQPPCAFVGPATVTWSSYCLTPTGASFGVVVAVAADRQATEKLYELVTDAAEAIAALTGGTVAQATPGSWLTGLTNLPSYELRVEMSLG